MTHFFPPSTNKVYYDQPYSEQSESFFSDTDIIATRNRLNKNYFFLYSKENWERTSSFVKATETQISISELGKNLKDYYSKNQFHLVEVDTRCKIGEHRKFRLFFSRLLSENDIELPDSRCTSVPMQEFDYLTARFILPSWWNQEDFIESSIPKPVESPSPTRSKDEGKEQEITQDDSEESWLTQEDPIESSSFPEPGESSSPTRSEDKGKEQEITQEELDLL